VPRAPGPVVRAGGGRASRGVVPWGGRGLPLLRPAGVPVRRPHRGRGRGEGGGADQGDGPDLPAGVRAVPAGRGREDRVPPRVLRPGSCGPRPGRADRRRPIKRGGWWPRDREPVGRLAAAASEFLRDVFGEEAV